MTNILTIDIEDWYQSSVYILGLSHTDISRRLLPSERVVTNTRRILHILAQYSAHATCFVLGSVAEIYPDLVREIHAAGHEVGCHGYDHNLVQNMTKTEFRKDVERVLQLTKSAIQNAECNILGYRAPYFSITENSETLLNMLVELGFVYDSSVLPIRRWWYGLPSWGGSQDIALCQKIGGLPEFPISTMSLLGQKFPLGGGYFRLLPYPLIKQAIGDINRRGQPVVFYLHPYELDAEELHEPLQGGAWKPRLVYWSQMLNRNKTEAKLRRLLADFRWTSVREWMERQ